MGFCAGSALGAAVMAARGAAAGAVCALAITAEADTAQKQAVILLRENQGPMENSTVL